MQSKVWNWKKRWNWQNFDPDEFFRSQARSMLWVRTINERVDTGSRQENSASDHIASKSSGVGCQGVENLRLKNSRLLETTFSNLSTQWKWSGRVFPQPGSIYVVSAHYQRKSGHWLSTGKLSQWPHRQDWLHSHRPITCLDWMETKVACKAVPYIRKLPLSKALATRLQRAAG